MKTKICFFTIVVMFALTFGSERYVFSGSNIKSVNLYTTAYGAPTNMLRIMADNNKNGTIEDNEVFTYSFIDVFTLDLAKSFQALALFSITNSCNLTVFVNSATDRTIVSMEMNPM
jgi:hypothetical protein